MRRWGRRDSGPHATYAAVLDGVHLWLEVENADAPVALKDVATKVTVEVGEGPFDLTGLTGETYDVVVRRTRVDLGGPHPIAPLSPDGVTRWEVTSDDGRLRLVRHTEPATAELDAIDVRGDRVYLRIRARDQVEPGCHLLLLDQDDALLATLPVTAHDGLLEALVSVDDLPAGYFGLIRLAVGTATDHVRIRRSRSDLADPNHAVLLPELFAEAGDEPRARFRWNPDGLLALRSIESEGEA